MNTYRVLSALLNYPTPELVDGLPEMKQILDGEAVLPAADRDALAPLLADLASADIYDLQAAYVELFDRYRSLSLHLFEHVHGESRDRGEAMVSLMERYRETGLELTGPELPDFLPVFLEYLSQLPAEEARQELADPVAVISALRRRLEKRQSPYAAVLSALEHLAEAEPDPAALEELSAEEASEAATLQDLDAEWQEEPVDFSQRESSFVGRQRARAKGAAFRKER